MPKAPVQNRAVAFGTATEILQGYTQRGFIFGLAEDEPKGPRKTYRILWHYNRVLPVVLDTAARRLSIRELLPGVGARDPMVTALRGFLKEFTDGSLPEHRRVDSRFGSLRLTTAGGAVSLEMDVRQAQYAYCLRRLVHVSHEIYMVFLRDGPYWEYRVQHLGLDPEAWA